MKRIVMMSALATLAACGPSDKSGTPDASPILSNASDDSGKLWTKVQYADRRTCPSDECGVVGRLMFREAATPFETKGEWVRTTKVYDAACENGESADVDSGNKSCTAENGIVDGRFAEWVRADQLSKVRPPDPADKATDNERIVKESDDFNIYHAAFAKVANQLIAEGRCTARDFEDNGGWVKSVNQYRDEPVYFTYCGGMTAADQIYMNAETATVM